jgi:predicted permease
MLTQSLRMLESQPLGFDPANRLVAQLDLPATYGGDLPRLTALFRTLRERVERLPGVSAMTYALYTPMEGNNWSGGIGIEGLEATPDRPLNSSWNRVAPGFFETLGTRVLRGRTLQAGDHASAPFVAVVNQTFANRYFPDADPIGRRLGLGTSRPRDYEIVGVTEDVKFSNAHLPTRPMIFLPDFQLVSYPSADGLSVQARSTLMRMLVIETRGATPSLEPALKRALADVDPNLTLVRLMSMQTQVAGNFRMNRLLARLTSAYGLVALALATLGLYAVTSYNVIRRRREIGVRMALGADRARVVREIVRGAVVQVVFGLAVGVPVTLLAARAIATQLYGVTPRDPVILGSAVIVLLASAAVSAAVPARRAASVNPTQALRAD